ncbi:hephaestin-like protein isoform X2 [Ptychodera flava]|uniref:hephaestin-like protein isoform X2 n=1 Tax=Ptychodera flava TaxID=63121 RepID=UPI00396A8BD3
MRTLFVFSAVRHQHFDNLGFQCSLEGVYTMEKFIFAVLLCSLHVTCDAVTRVHYITCDEEEWDYAPGGKNMINGKLIEDDPNAKPYLSGGPDRIGAKYKKAHYYEYTDSTYTVRMPRPAWLGMLGPILKGETGDVMSIYFFNNCSRGYSVHVHGLFYSKSNEGALYHDNTVGDDKADDDVPPGGSHHYEWVIDVEASPHDDDPACLAWAYHSHVDSPKDTNSGLVGLIITCKPGTLDDDGKRVDVDHEFVLLMTTMDENESWYLDDNIETYCTSPDTVDTESEDFIESNKMYMINGYMFGNLPEIKVCSGDKVAWYVFGMGTEIDIHTIYFHGQNMIYDGHRTDAIGIVPALFTSSVMTAGAPGIWLGKCATTSHYDSGMSFLLNVQNCSAESGAGIHGLTDHIREYFIQAEEVYWDYGPSGFNNYYGGSLTDSESESAAFFEKGEHRIGGVYKKAVYVEYTDDSFATEKGRAPEDEHMGLLGPAIRAEVGDQIRVTFRNNASRPYSMHPHGVYYDKANEGAGYEDGTTGSDNADDAVAPGNTYVYEWSVPVEWNPALDDDDCSTYMYYSSVEPTRDQYSGLVGPLIVCKVGILDPNSIQGGISREVYLYYGIFDENQSWYVDENIQEFCTDPDGVDTEDEDFVFSNQMHSVNGYLFANMPNLELCKGDQVNFHVMTLGNNEDIMGIHFHGNTLVWNSNHADTIPIRPGIFRHGTMRPDNEGEWGIVCKNNNHFKRGMMVKYNVDSCENTTPKVKETNFVKGARVIYIGAVELEWDYAPNGYDGLTGGSLYDPDNHGYVFANRGNVTIGHKYKKVVYREFMGSDFKEQVQRTPEEEHLALLGPLIRTQVGDTIEVVFKNMASRSYSIHPHGVLYDKTNEGAKYEDGITESPGDAVEPGKTHTYTWEVPARAGPTDEDSNCLTWVYYSAVDTVKDTNSGLIGPLIVCRQGLLDTSGKRTDVDHEFALLFSVNDENESWYLDENIQTYCYIPGEVDKGDGDFEESNLMHGINGKIYSNLQGLTMNTNDKVDWYLISLGSEVDMHSVHFHGETFVHNHGVGDHRADVYDLFPGVVKTVGMVVDNPGQWMLHCHVNDHINAGMDAMYTVLDSAKPTGGGKPSSASLNVGRCYLMMGILNLLMVLVLM